MQLLKHACLPKCPPRLGSAGGSLGAALSVTQGRGVSFPFISLQYQPAGNAGRLPKNDAHFGRWLQVSVFTEGGDLNRAYTVAFNQTRDFLMSVYGLTETESISK